MAYFRDYLSRFLPEGDGASVGERAVSALAAGGALLLISLVSSHWLESSLFIVVSIAASAVLVFSLPHSPVAQPWSIIGGYLVCSLSGVFAAQSGLTPLWAGGLAVALASLAMLSLRCLHPPGGAVALYAVAGGDQVRALGYSYVLTPCLANAVMLVLLALLINNLLPRRHYPRRPLLPHVHASGLTAADITAALAEYGHPLASSEEEIDAIIDLAEGHAARRAEAARQR